MKELIDKDTIKDAISVIKFGALWCPPCVKLIPVLEKLALNYPHITFYTIDVDENQKLAKQFKVRGLPTLLMLKDGTTEIAREIGFNSVKQIEDF